VLIEHRRADQRNFPALLPESLSSLKRNYKIRIGAEGRVAGRRTRAVVIKPRDELRYGYQLWADKATGLLLSAGLVDERGTLIEQYMFTQISIGLPIPDDELKPQTPAGKLVRRPPDAQEVAAAPSRWTAGELPAGFALTARMWRAPQGSRAPMEHLVYSDGLAVVSVFIEPLVESDQNEPLGGITRIGAMHIYGRSTDGHQVTVMGEVPAATVSMVGDSVRLQP
jgi:sigma-E factor negative regulatory protein RseB